MTTTDDLIRQRDAVIAQAWHEYELDLDMAAAVRDEKIDAARTFYNLPDPE